jgi:hypothetical protein
VTAIRVHNLAEIRLGTNLVRPGGPGLPFLLAFSEYDTKNRAPLQFMLDATSTGVIDEYVSDYRPILMRGQTHDILFPGTGCGAKGTKTLGPQISERIWKEVG